MSTPSSTTLHWLRIEVSMSIHSITRTSISRSHQIWNTGPQRSKRHKRKGNRKGARKHPESLHSSEVWGQNETRWKIRNHTQIGWLCPSSFQGERRVKLRERRTTCDRASMLNWITHSWLTAWNQREKLTWTVSCKVWTLIHCMV